MRDFIAKKPPVDLLYYCFSDQAEARRNKVKEARKRRDERQTTKRQEVLKSYAKEDEVDQK